MRKTTMRRFVALAAVTTLALAGCGRGDSDDGGGGGGEAAGSTAGITSEPCPEAFDESNGCIYIGIISDFTGPFAPIGGPMVEGAQAYWKQVNEDGGIGGYEIDISTHVKDNAYDPTTHAQVYQEIKDEIALIGHSMGTAHTNSVLTDTRKESLVVVPASLGSNWMFEDGILNVGTTYCAEAMNAVDYAVDELGAKSIGAVHFPGDYGDDAGVGARIAAEARGVEFFDYPTGQGGVDEQTAVISGLLKDKPDAVIVATSAVEVAAVVGATVSQGFEGKFIGSIPAWSGALLDTPAAPALEASYLHASSIGAWDADTPGHEAMRESVGDDVQPNDWFATGWAGSHAIQALIEKAVDEDNLTREGLVDALNSMDGIDSQGMLPEGDGKFDGEPNENTVRSTFINKVDPSTATGISELVPAFTGPTAESYEFTGPCYEQ